jgi:hypothetical protein
MIAVLSQNLLGPMSLTLLAQARQELAHGRHQFAVVLTQVACELRTEDAIIEMMRKRKIEYLSDAVMNIFKTTSLGDERLRKIFAALAAADPAQESWWSAWITGRQLRHDVAHHGDQVTPEQAQSCINAAADFIAYVTTTVNGVRTE